MTTHSSILAWRVPRTEEPAWWATVHRVAKSQTQLKQLSTHTPLNLSPYFATPLLQRAAELFSYG